MASSEIFRGESTSGDDPALSLAVSYDHPSGLFAGAGITIAAGAREPRIQSATQYAGLALRKGEFSFEFGAIHRHYDAASLVDEAYRNNYFEAFAGISRRSMRLRIYIAPDYLKDRQVTYYGEFNTRLLKAGKWSINGHAGLSMIPSEPGETGMRYYEDWSLQAGRPVGKFAVSLGVADTNYPVFSVSKGDKFFSNGPRVYATISRAF